MLVPVKRRGRPKKPPGAKATPRKSGRSDSLLPGQKSALRKLARYSGDIECLLDDVIRMVEYQVEAAKTELTTGLGYKQEQMDPIALGKIEKLADTIGTLLAAKERWLKMDATGLANLTPEAVLEGAIQRILSRPAADRRKAIDRLIAEHVKKGASAMNGNGAVFKRTIPDVVDAAETITALDEIKSLLRDE